MNTNLRIAAVLLLAIAYPAALRADDFQSVSVVVEPARVELPDGAEQTNVTYRFTNSSKQVFEVVERTAFWHSLDNEWQSRRLGPVPTPLKLPPSSTVDWRDRPRLWDEIINGASQAQGLASGELLLVQHFTLVSAGGEKTHVAASLIFKVKAGNAALDDVDLAHYRLTALRAFQENDRKKEHLAKLTAFADESYEKLKAVLGFVPNDGRKIPLRIKTYGGNPYYTPAEGGYMNIPCDVVESQSSSEWLWVAYPHELTHYFLLQEFPNPPRWFVEGPASFFGNKVSEQLHREKMAAEDRQKILDWGKKYREGRYDFLFQSAWPKDGPHGNLSEMGSYGMGRAYEICTKLEALCGEEFFRNVFRHMRENRVSFRDATTEKARNETLIAAMQTQTDKDLWAFFAAEGFAR